MELDEPAVILKMVSEGLGCAIIPGQLVPLDSTPGVQVLPLPGKPLLREIGMLVRQSALKQPAVATLIESFEQEVAARYPG
jgi:DNA-binding transcriptional LysR family regulator